MATVSIIIPTFNRSKLLAECVNSLLAQNYAGMEIIVVDDGSTDDTNSTVLEITQKHKNVRYYSRPHHGASAARNFGLEQTNAEYIGFFDSDDLWPPNYIETMIGTLQANPDFDVAYSNIMRLVDDKITGRYITIAEPPRGNIARDLFLRVKPFNLPSSTIFRKKALAGVFWDETLKRCDDCDVFLRVSTKSKFIYVPDVYLMYRKTEDSLSAAHGKNLFTAHTCVLERFYFYLGGDSYVPRKLALRKISHSYRSLALKHYRAGNRKASITLLKRALYYRLFDLRLYVNLFRAFLLNPQNDKMPDWQIPIILPARPQRDKKNNKQSATTKVQYIPS
jgi:glycosyltransferase involved in cell wall biosynthesis